MHAVVVELKLWKQLSIHEYFIIVALSSAEAPAGHPNKNSNNQKVESVWGKMVFSFSLSPAIPRSPYRGESHCRKTQIQYHYRLSNHQTMLLKGSIGSFQKSVMIFFISVIVKYCWFACDVTAAMLVVKNKCISFLTCITIWSRKIGYHYRHMSAV